MKTIFYLRPFLLDCFIHAAIKMLLLGLMFCFFFSVDGQAIAQRLSKQINNAGTKIRRELDRFNAEMSLMVTQADQIPSEVSFQQLCDLSSTLWNNIAKDDSQKCHVPQHVRLYLLDIVHKINHSVEEKELLEEEMNRMMSSLQEEASDALKELSDTNQDPRQSALIKKKMSNICSLIESCKINFSPCISVMLHDDYSAFVQKVYRIGWAECFAEEERLDVVNGVGCAEKSPDESSESEEEEEYVEGEEWAGDETETDTRNIEEGEMADGGGDRVTFDALIDLLGEIPSSDEES